MKIIHFSRSDDKGAFLAAYRFHRQLIAAGHESVMMVAKKTRTDAEIIEVRTNPVTKLYIRAQKFLFGKLIKYKTDHRYHFYNFSENYTYPAKAIEKNMPFVPDIIMVHWVTGFINTKSVHQLSSRNNTPVVWRFNDLNAFTGGCHYSNGCTRYFQGCGNCPALFSKKENDRSARNLQQKIKWLSKTNVTFVASTTEINEQLCSSAVSRISKTSFIIISVAGEHFYPATDKDAVAVSLGFPAGKKIIYFGAQNMNDPRKGFREFADALRELKKILPAETAEKVLLVYSTNEENTSIEWSFDHVRLDYIKGDGKLSDVYRAATIFASPSIEDAGPMMLAEAMLCGTPAVAYSIGLAKDAVLNNMTGIIVPPVDIHKFAAGLKTILEMDENSYKNLSQNCFSKATALFSQEKETAAYEQLFEKLLKP